MAKREILEKRSMAHLLKAVSHLVQLPRTHMWLDYDEGADVLYVHFDDRPRSTHGGKPLHVVVALNELAPRLFIITAYEPDLDHFEPDFRTRRRQ